MGLNNTLFMEVEDLKKVITIAETENMQIAASKLNLTAGAMSKALSRIETNLRTKLFDRIGRNIKLNNDGKKFLTLARDLVEQSQHLEQQFISNHSSIKALITGPAILLSELAAKIHHHLAARNKNFILEIDNDFEDQAIKKVSQNHAQVAVVTEQAKKNYIGEDISFIPLHKIEFKILCGSNHPLLKKKKLLLNDIEDYGFICPDVSRICGLQQGKGSDGWNDKAVKRNISTHISDISITLALLQKTEHLAYLPQSLQKNNQLASIELEDCPYHCVEQIMLAYKPKYAHGWLLNLIQDLQ